MKIILAFFAAIAVASASSSGYYDDTTTSFDTTSSGYMYSSGSSYEFSGLCDGAVVGQYVYPGQVVVGNTNNRHTTLPPGFAECGSSTANTGVWFTVTGFDTDITISSAGSEYDTYLKVFECDGTGYYQEECVTFNDDCDSSLQAVAHFFARFGKTYKVFLSGYFNQGGAYELAVIGGHVESCGASYSESSTIAYNDGTTMSSPYSPSYYSSYYSYS